MEFRTRIELPTFPSDDRWQQLYGWLDEQTDMGPVFEGPSDDAPGLTVILATDADDQAAAVRATVDAVTHALEAVQLGEHYPAHVEVEPVTDDQLAPAA